MASSSFTPNLGLCNWSADDKPKRADFVSDNGIIDTALGGHINNGSIHLTASEKEKALSPFAVVPYSGDGKSSRTIQAGFAPKLALVYLRNAPCVEYAGGATIINSAIAYYGMGGSSGLSLSSSGIVVSQQTTPVDGVRHNLNETDGQYVSVLFK